MVNQHRYMKSLFITENSEISEETYRDIMSSEYRDVKDLIPQKILDKYKTRRIGSYIGIICCNNSIYVFGCKYGVIDYDHVFRVLFTENWNSDAKYYDSLEKLFKKVSFRNSRRIIGDINHDYLIEYHNLINAFVKYIGRIMIPKKYSALRGNVKKLSEWCKKNSFEKFPSFLFNTSLLFELYVGSILDRKYPRRKIVYHKYFPGNNNDNEYDYDYGWRVPDYVICKKGMIIDAKYLGLDKKIDRESFTRMEKYRNNREIRNLIDSDKPNCFFFCSGIEGYNVSEIVRSDLKIIAERIDESPSFYKVSVKIPIKKKQGSHKVNRARSR